MTLKSFIKSRAAEQDKTLTEIASTIYKDVQNPAQNLTNKINKDTIRYNEVVKILDSLGYDLVIQDRNTQQIIKLD